MACSRPIWIRNRRYFDKKNPSRQATDAQISSLALRPWDVSRQWLMVPCGKCDDCLRRLRNDWFVRLERELAFCRANSLQATFITITISPKYYGDALLDPAGFIRRWNERVRHRIGHSFKHAFFQEFGSHPQMGGEPRLHFHGFLFGLNVLYSELRSAVGDLGFVWLSKATPRRARYCVKYVVKQIGCPPEVADKIVTVDGKPCKLSALLEHRRYTRKFISAGVGDYLGTRCAPSATIASWDYLDAKTSCVYSYTIPRYYNRYLKSEDETRRAVLAAHAYASFSKSALVRHILTLCLDRFAPFASVSYRKTYNWQVMQYRRFAATGKPLPNFDPPAWLTVDIVHFWNSEYNLQLQI